MIGALCQAEAQDARTVAALMTQSEPAQHDHITGAELMIARGWVRVWREAEQTLGCLARDAQMIHALYVAPAHHGRGIGARLLREAQAQSSALTLWTSAGNCAAARFYRHMGFAESYCMPAFASSDGVNERWFTWQRAEGQTHCTHQQRGYHA